ncbi:hypothetical protein [Sciscionella marina]|uniref:hypothetical protein n=1 Tax=Sciscionella marina TaxID=508770 RepID=UPI00039D602F|nr:hypothetical protein [Sciscionella marina]
MSLRERMRQALPEAMRARDRVAVSVLRATLGALDNAEAVPVAETRGMALEQAPVGVGATEVARRELDEDRITEIVRAEAEERLATAAGLTEATQQEHAGRLRAEAAVLQRLLDEPTSGRTR